MNKLTRKQAHSLFCAEFGEICRARGGTYSEADAHGDGAAYRIPTPFGELRASTEMFSAMPGHENKSKLGTIFLCWREYAGPVPFPMHGTFNDYSHKWNIHCAGATLEDSRRHALNELRVRLGLLEEMAVNA